MEEKSITAPAKSSMALSLLKYILWSIPLAIPILGIMVFDGKVLAEIVDLGDPVPVNLETDVPLPMVVVSWCLIVALVSAFTPWKRISSLAVGLAIGGITFYALDQYEQLKDMEEMGLSSTPLMEMVNITTDGKYLIVFIALCLMTQTLYAFFPPCRFGRLVKADPDVH